MVASVVLNSNSLSTDRLYDYAIPDSLSDKVKVGVRVKVPFGRGNKLTEAYVISVSDSSSYKNLKNVSGLINEVSYFSENRVKLIEFMRHRYFCTYISAIRCMIPPGVNTKFEKYVQLTDSALFEEAKSKYSNSMTADKLLSLLNAYGCTKLEALKTEIGATNFNYVLNKLKKDGYVQVVLKESEKIKDTLRTFVSLAVDRNEAYAIADSIYKKAPARARVIEILCENYDVELSELLVYAQTSKSTIDALCNKGVVKYDKIVCNDSELNIDTSYSKNKPVLNQYQANAVRAISEGIISDTKSVYVIHGVTGSGKTEVYLSAIENTINSGKDAIMLVPEISLTPQMISQIYGRFGNNVAVLHSKLTLKQRYIEWNRINNGDVKIAIGARSAIFAPFKKIGLIIIDEEHEITYKSEMMPRYNAVEIARFITEQNKSTLVLASATPSVEDYYKISTGAYKLIEMPERINKSPLPEVKIVDMRSELQNGNLSIFSSELKELISSTLSKKEQIILFLNRRGFSGFVSCRNCGYVVKCPNCNISLKYHKTVNKMICHYCDYKMSELSVCPKCSSKHIRFFGIGTEKIVEELYKLYPETRVLRMDADTTSGKMGHENIISRFKNGDADILVGTQMITKGLDFENVTLVGIIAADMSLNVDDFRAGERTFDLITQVIGRAGRSAKSGKAVIQTYNPDDEILNISAKQDYISFYKEEIKIRQMLTYPPFTEFIKIQFSGADKTSTKKAADEFCTMLKKYTAENDFSGTVYNVSEAPLFIINKKYRYRILIKTPYKKAFYDSLHSMYDFFVSKNNDVSISVDVNPIGTN